MTSTSFDPVPGTPDTVQPLPLPFDIETKKVLRKEIEATKHLAELKGVVRSIPNEQILINTLLLQEAKDSSAVENIITTHDELFQADLFSDQFHSWETKEVLNYAEALRTGYAFVKENGFLTGNAICEIQRILEGNSARKYLNTLAEERLLQKLSIGKFNYYVNPPLFDLFANRS